MSQSQWAWCPTPNLPTKIIPAKIRWLNVSGKFPMGMGIPPLRIKIMLESDPPKSRILVRRLAVRTPNPPTKSLGFEGLDSSRLLIRRGGNSHVRRIW